MHSCWLFCRRCVLATVSELLVSEGVTVCYHGTVPDTVTVTGCHLIYMAAYLMCLGHCEDTHLKG